MIADKMEVINKTPKEEIHLGEFQRNDLIRVAASLFIKIGTKNKGQLRDEIIRVNDIIGLYTIRKSTEYPDDMTVRELRKHLKGVDKHGAKSKEDLLKIAIAKQSTKEDSSTKQSTKEDSSEISTGKQVNFVEEHDLPYEEWPVDDLVFLAKNRYGIKNTCGKSIVKIIGEIRENDEII